MALYIISTRTIYISAVKLTHLDQSDLITSANITNFLNNHTNDTNWGVAKCVKLFGKIVFLQGMIRGANSGVPVCVLPEGFRPSTHLIIPIASNSNNAHAYIYPNGQVHIVGNGGEYVSLSGISFILD